MVTRLREKGFIASGDANALFNENVIGKNCYDLVSMLNVLDRADKPISMLKALKSCIKKDGRILLAVVLPFCPFVESGTKQLEPTEKLNMEGGLCVEGASFERSVALLNKQLFLPLDLEIEKWSKLPYISEGDQKKEFYVLEDAIFLLRKKKQQGDDDLLIIPPNVDSLNNFKVSASSNFFGLL